MNSLFTLHDPEFYNIHTWGLNELAAHIISITSSGFFPNRTYVRNVDKISKNSDLSIWNVVIYELLLHKF